MRVKKSTHVRKPARAKKSARETWIQWPVMARIRWPETTRSRTVALAAVAIVGAGILISAGSRTKPVSAAAADVRADSASIPLESAPNPSLPSDAQIASESTSNASASKATPVTITGCLERNHETFELRDTSGPDAPRSRSWRSAFLKRSAASIEVVDTAGGVRLPSHVGQRVTVKGTLVDREMQVRSLQRVAASCDKTPKA